jgi:hypothetical protein
METQAITWAGNEVFVAISGVSGWTARADEKGKKIEARPSQGKTLGERNRASILVNVNLRS